MAAAASLAHLMRAFPASGNATAALLGSLNPKQLCLEAYIARSHRKEPAGACNGLADAADSGLFYSRSSLEPVCAGVRNREVLCSFRELIISVCAVLTFLLLKSRPLSQTWRFKKNFFF